MDDVIYNYIQKQLSEVPMILNRRLSYNGIEFNSKYEFRKLKSMIDSFLNNESEERYFVLPGIRGVGKTTILFQYYKYLLKKKNFKLREVNIPFQHRDACHFGALLSLLVVTYKLTLQNAIICLDLLFFHQLKAVLGDLSARATVLLSLLADPFQGFGMVVDVHAQTTAELKPGLSSRCHFNTPFRIQYFLGFLRPPFFISQKILPSYHEKVN